MDLFNLGFNPKELIDSLAQYMRETRRELNEINRKLDLLMEANNVRKSA